MIKSPINAMINIIYFSLNFTSDFIDRCWTNKDDARHFQQKFNQIYQSRGTSTFIHFFGELSENNQNKLCKWINENYLAFPRLVLENKQSNLKAPLMKTVRDYKVAKFKQYGEVIVPKGTVVKRHYEPNGDGSYSHFVDEFDWIDDSYPEYSNILKMDVENYGIIIPLTYLDLYQLFKYDTIYKLETLEEVLESEMCYLLMESNDESINNKKKPGDVWATIKTTSNISYKFELSGYDTDGERTFKLIDIEIEE